MALASAGLLVAACSGDHVDLARPVSGISNGGASGKGMAGGGAGGSVVGPGGMGGDVVPTGGMGGSVGGGPAGAPGGMNGTGKGGTGMGVAGHGAGGTATGQGCGANSDCMTGFCVDGVCCENQCAGMCRTCAGHVPGKCELADDGTDPRNNCDALTPDTCKTVGTCNATGACKMYDKTTICSSVPSCNSTASAIVQNKTCDGVGNCIAGAVMDCNGFLCSGAAGSPTCGSICGADTDCVAGGFCSASRCIAVPNIIANGDVETNTLSEWQATNGTGTLNIATAATPADVHGGGFSVYENGRMAPYQGPGVTLPTGLGKYKISVWAMQKEDPFLTGVVQIRLDCPDNGPTNGSYIPVQEGSAFGISMTSGTWTQFTALVDTSDPLAATTPLCRPTGPGLVKNAVLYLNQVEKMGDPTFFPNLYMDDVVVTVPDGHNLIGNPNFDAGLTSGWISNGGKMLISSTNAHGGSAKSLSLTMRTTPGTGIKYMLPNGAARYTVSYWVLQTGTMDHMLQFQPTYTCIPTGGAAAVSVNATPSTPMNAAPNTWVQVSHTFVMPPVDAPVGCVLQQASVTLQQADAGGTCAGGECPDLYLDDASLVIPVQ